MTPRAWSCAAIAGRHEAVVVIGTSAMTLVEFGQSWVTNATADWLYGMDHALARPTITIGIRADDDIGGVAATVLSPGSSK